MKAATAMLGVAMALLPAIALAQKPSAYPSKGQSVEQQQKDDNGHAVEDELAGGRAGAHQNGLRSLRTSTEDTKRMTSIATLMVAA